MHAHFVEDLSPHDSNVELLYVVVGKKHLLGLTGN